MDTWLLGLFCTSMSFSLDKALEGWTEKAIDDALTHEKKGVKLIVHFLIGAVAEQEIHVIHTAKCVLPDAADEKGDDLSRLLDEDWISDNAEKVIRMLPGGISVIGLAAFCGAKLFMEQRIMLTRALAKIHRISTALSCLDLEVLPSKLGLLHVDTSSKKTMAVSTDVARRGPDAVYKVSYSAQRWVSVVSRVCADMRAAIAVQAACDFYTELTTALRPWATSLFNSQLFTFDGEIRDDSEPLFRDAKKAKNATVVQAQIFLPAEGGEAMDEERANEEVFEVSVDIAVRAVVSANATICDAKRALRHHIMRNILARASLHYESMELLEGDSGAAPALHQLPRAATTLLSNHSSVLLYDFLFDGDTTDDARRNFEQLLGVRAGAEEVDDLWERNLTREEVEEPSLMLHSPAKAGTASITLPIIALSFIVIIVAFVMYLVLGK